MLQRLTREGTERMVVICGAGRESAAAATKGTSTSTAASYWV